MSGTGGPLDAIAALVLERQRYEAWIAALDAKRAITPPHVFTRVRGDYDARLREVTDQLLGRAVEVRQTLELLTSRLGALQAEENARRDARYEAELRAAVGEYTPEQWKEVARRMDEEIIRLATERTNVGAEIAQLRQILSMAGGAPPPAPTAPRAPGSFDELAFLQSVVQPKSDGAGGVARGRAAGEGAPAAPRVPTGATPGSQGTVRTPTPAPPSHLPPAFPPAPPRPDLGAGKPVHDPDPEAVPSFLRDVPQENVKTLRCGECGAMNYPTEWYCEACGAELVAG